MLIRQKCPLDNLPDEAAAAVGAEAEATAMMGRG